MTIPDVKLAWQPNVEKPVDLAEWPEINAPKQLDLDRLPPFPTHLLPPRLGAMVRQAASVIQAPVDIAGMLVLPICSTTLSGKVRFVGRAGHEEHAMIWTLTVAASSERKTPVFEMLRKPLNELASELTEHALVENEIRLTALDMVVSQIDELKKVANKSAIDHGKTSLTDSAQAELRTLITERRKLEKPKPKPTEWVTSPTPEGLQRVMADNVGRCAIFTEEGGIIGTLAGRYSGKDGADMDPFLQGYVGQPLKAPRAGSDRPYVDAAYLTIGLAVQPTILDDLAAIRGVEERGLVGRFLFALSTSLVGTRMYGDSAPIDPDVIREYTDTLQDWAAWPGHEDGSLEYIGLDDAAYQKYEKFHDSIEIRQREGADLAGVFTASKIAGTTLRLAGLFHCYDLGRYEALRVKIGEDPMTRAIDLVEGYFIPHALRVSEQFKDVGPQGTEVRILAWAKSKKARHFKIRDLSRALVNTKRGTIQSQKDLLDPLEALVEEGYLKLVPDTRAPEYRVNPRLFMTDAA